MTRKGLIIPVVLVAIPLLFYTFDHRLRYVSKIGETQTVRNSAAVEAVNASPIMMKRGGVDDEISEGDVCDIKAGGKVTTIGFDGERALYSYTAPGNLDEDDCPSAVLFFLSNSEFGPSSAIDGVDEQVLNGAKRETETVHRLMREYAERQGK